MTSEFEFIDLLKRRYGLGRIGDDCAILPKDDATDLVVTADMLVQDIDFRLDWTTAELLGHKALAISLSDIAAMGAKPVWAMVSIAVPRRLWDAGFVAEFYAGWFTLANKHGVDLVGGDLSGTRSGLVIDSIVGGEVAKGRAILRSGAKPGDAIYVSGSLGGAAGGLSILENNRGSNGNEDLVFKQLQPWPKVELGKLLQDLGVISSMIDISDGISSDLGHICKASGVGARIYADRLPLNPELEKEFESKESLDMALNGGEDFELLFTGQKTAVETIDIPWITCIGEITDTADEIELFSDGDSTLLVPAGFLHF